MTASVRFAIDGLPDAIQLPLTAMTEQAGIPGVWVVDPAASTVSFHSVTTSAVVGNQVLIGAGITPGDVVVTAGAPLLRAGQKVRLLDAAVASR
jgi:multidrug efflux pump subunit AcrA (membrane-fusion protein)